MDLTVGKAISHNAEAVKEIKKKINEHKPFLRNRFKVKSIGIFGSYLRWEQNERSDIDILVEFSDVIDLFEFVRLENFLSDILGRKVDLVMKDALKPRIKKRILEEAVYV
ncbi:MAG: nucleotidyltransferase family protein [Candidatus Methanofastidiosia archaeon]